jgi:hypothetical protein
MRQLEELAGTYQARRAIKKPGTSREREIRAKKERLDGLSPGKTQKPKGTFSRAALSCDVGKELQVAGIVN